MISAQCPQCGRRLQEEESIRDFFDPSNYYGHGQVVSIVYICTNDECDYVVDAGEYQSAGCC